jgi:hypothetical protein
VTTRHGWAVLAVAAVALSLVWHVLPAGAPPIYDGQCIADPYVTLAESPPAKGTTQTFSLQQLQVAGEVVTDESPPQAQLLLEANTFSSATALTMSITPIPAPDIKPPKGTIQGNVYRFSALTPAGSEVEPATSSLAATIILRGTTSTPAPTIERFNGKSWTALATFNAGCGNTFEATSTLLGDFAAVATGPAGQQPTTAPGGFPGLAIIGVLLLVLIVAVIALFTLDRGRNRTSER